MTITKKDKERDRKFSRTGEMEEITVRAMKR